MTLSDICMYCGAAYGSGVACGYVYRQIFRLIENLGS